MRDGADLESNCAVIQGRRHSVNLHTSMSFVDFASRTATDRHSWYGHARSANDDRRRLWSPT